MNSKFSLLSRKSLARRQSRLIVGLTAFITALFILTSSMGQALAAYSLETKIFAKVPSPGFPEGVVVADNDTIYVGTHQGAVNIPNTPSHVFAYDKTGKIKRDYVIQGQDPTGQGILGMALDGKGDLYILDRNPARVIRLNPKTGEQTTYATFKNVKPCVEGQPAGDCSAESEDRSVYPDDLVFAPDGTLYVTDLQQALIWRIPAGGGKAEVWYTHKDLDSVFGPNGIRFTDNGRTLMFAQSLHGITDHGEIFNGGGKIYKLPINSNGKPGKRTLLWEGAIGDGPDGFAIGESGKVYVSMALPGALMVLSPKGKELYRTPSTPEENAQQEVPYNLPANVAFHEKQVLVTNQAFLDGNTAHHVVFKVNVNEKGKALFRPFIKK